MLNNVAYIFKPKNKQSEKIELAAAAMSKWRKASKSV